MESFFKYVALASLFLASCGSAQPPVERPALTALLHEKKFEPHGFYTGADTPEDQQPLQTAVDGAITDIGSLPDPLNKDAVRTRLAKLIDDTDLYATEDRDEVGRYAIRIWRAAGFNEESRLFPVSDKKVLALP
jgi:hypothetical protein